jgi:uncharacterized protein
MIHQYKLGGYNVVLDICSGAVHLVDDIAYDMIEIFENHTQGEVFSKIKEKYSSLGISDEEISTCYSQVEELKKSGTLFTPDTLEPMADKLKQKTSGVIKALCLHVAHTCN